MAGEVKESGFVRKETEMELVDCYCYYEQSVEIALCFFRLVDNN